MLAVFLETNCPLLHFVTVDLMRCCSWKCQKSVSCHQKSFPIYSQTPQTMRNIIAVLVSVTDCQRAFVAGLFNVRC